MKTSLLRLIRCPDCGAALGLVSAHERNAEIVSGILQCEGCRSSFPIENGLPVILRSDALSERTRRSFGKQWKLHEQRRFDQETIYGKNRQEGLNDFQRAFGLTDLASLQNCLILDAGCGSGVLTADIGRAVPAATVVGVDFSESARLASERCRLRTLSTTSSLWNSCIPIRAVKLRSGSAQMATSNCIFLVKLPISRYAARNNNSPIRIEMVCAGKKVS